MTLAWFLAAWIGVARAQDSGALRLDMIRLPIGHGTDAPSPAQPSFEKPVVIPRSPALEWTRIRRRGVTVYLGRTSSALLAGPFYPPPGSDPCLDLAGSEPTDLPEARVNWKRATPTEIAQARQKGIGILISRTLDDVDAGRWDGVKLTPEQRAHPERAVFCSGTR